MPLAMRIAKALGQLAANTALHPISAMRPNSSALPSTTFKMTPFSVRLASQNPSKKIKVSIGADTVEKSCIRKSYTGVETAQTRVLPAYEHLPLDRKEHRSPPPETIRTGAEIYKNWGYTDTFGLTIGGPRNSEGGCDGAGDVLPEQTAVAGSKNVKTWKSAIYSFRRDKTVDGQDVMPEALWYHSQTEKSGLDKTDLPDLVAHGVIHTEEESIVGGDLNDEMRSKTIEDHKREEKDDEKDEAAWDRCSYPYTRLF